MPKDRRFYLAYLLTYVANKLVIKVSSNKEVSLSHLVICIDKFCYKILKNKKNHLINLVFYIANMMVDSQNQ